MRLHKAQRRYGCEISIAPLIDVVFLLIIFFMTISQISKVEVEKLALPEAEAGEVSEPEAPGPLIVNVHDDGRIVVGGSEKTLRSLGDLLDGQIAKHSAAEVMVLIRGDRDAPWEQVSDVMRLCAGRGIDKVKVAVLESEGGGPAL